MDLREEFLNLSVEKRRFVHLELCENALSVLENYFAENSEIKYVESVVGTLQIFDAKLPPDALDAARNGENLHNVDYRFAEPISALQDDDLELPDNIELAFYSIYNLFQKYVMKRQIDDWIIVNQALSAEVEPEKWTEMLKKAIEKSKL